MHERGFRCVQRPPRDKRKCFCEIRRTGTDFWQHTHIFPVCVRVCARIRWLHKCMTDGSLHTQTHAMYSHMHFHESLHMAQGFEKQFSLRSCVCMCAGQNKNSSKCWQRLPEHAQRHSKIVPMNRAAGWRRIALLYDSNIANGHESKKRTHKHSHTLLTGSAIADGFDQIGLGDEES